MDPPKTTKQKISDTLSRLNPTKKKDETKADDEIQSIFGAEPSAPLKSALKQDEIEIPPPFNPEFGLRRSPRLKSRAASTTSIREKNTPTKKEKSLGRHSTTPKSVTETGTKMKNTNPLSTSVTSLKQDRPRSTLIDVTPKEGLARSPSVNLGKGRPPSGASKQPSRSVSRASSVQTPRESRMNTPVEIKRPSAFKPVEPAPRSYRPASALSTFSDFLPREKPVGMANLFQPLIGSNNLQMKERINGKKYPTEMVDQIRHRVNENWDPEVVRNHFLDELTKLTPDNEVPYEHVVFITDPGTLPPAPEDKFNEFEKQMRKQAGAGLGIGSPKLKSFLNAFVNLASNYKLNAAQCAGSLPNFFDSSLDSKISRRIVVKGFVQTLHDLRRLLCTTTNIAVCQETLDNFSPDVNDLKKSLFELTDLVSCTNPQASENEINMMVRRQFMSSIPRELAVASRAKEEEWRFKYPGRAYPFSNWESDMVDLIATKGKKYKSIKTIETHLPTSSEGNNSSLTLEDLKSCLSTLKLEQQANTGQMQSKKTYKKETPKPATAEQFQKAANDYPITALVSQAFDYPHENATTLPYKMINGTFVPNENIMAVPDKSVFVSYSSGKTVLSNPVLNHFKGRCSGCGIRGHTAAHPNCPYSNLASTWYVCTRCRAGLHPKTDCITSLEKVQPHSYFRPNGRRE